MIVFTLTLSSGIHLSVKVIRLNSLFYSFMSRVSSFTIEPPTRRLIQRTIFIIDSTLDFLLQRNQIIIPLMEFVLTFEVSYTED